MTTDTADKLARLRDWMATHGADAFIVSVGDEYLGEYVPASEARLEWLTGFSGSAGTAVVTRDKAAFFTDGRYTVQAELELDESHYECYDSAETSPEKWLQEQLKEGASLSYDPKLISQQALERLQDSLGKTRIMLNPALSNPIDTLWEGRPDEPASEVRPHPIHYSGLESSQKYRDMAQALKEQGADAAVLVASDSVCWLLNMRGQDVAHSPLVRAPALVHADGRVILFIDKARLAKDLAFDKTVTVQPLWQLEEALQQCGAVGSAVLIDKQLTPAWYVQQLEKAGAALIYGDDPCQLPKAIKNPIELEGMRKAHQRDGVAVIRFLAWLSQQSGISELQVVIKLLECRRMADEFVSPSFDTIAGSGPHGAIVHYRVSEHSDRVLQPGELFLLDSGGQYADGTTDITRTVAIGVPGSEEKERFTLVLKGHIALAAAQFPEGTGGVQLDALARAPLWAEGLDFEHGTGHGVGSFLNVHEGPQRIGKRGGHVPLVPGMILSNEPGYYKKDAYGIRIENLVAVVEKGKMQDSAKKLLGFNTLTCVPIDLTLVEPAMLTQEECEWLNAYHGWVRNTQSPHLSTQEQAWLENATREI